MGVSPANALRVGLVLLAPVLLAPNCSSGGSDPSRDATGPSKRALRQAYGPGPIVVNDRVKVVPATAVLCVGPDSGPGPLTEREKRDQSRCRDVRSGDPPVLQVGPDDRFRFLLASAPASVTIHRPFGELPAYGAVPSSKLIARGKPRDKLSRRWEFNLPPSVEGIVSFKLEQPRGTFTWHDVRIDRPG